MTTARLDCPRCNYETPDEALYILHLELCEGRGDIEDARVRELVQAIPNVWPLLRYLHGGECMGCSRGYREDHADGCPVGRLVKAFEAITQALAPFQKAAP